jgi:hypothetical protein
MLRKFGCVLAAVTMSYGAALADADSDAAKRLGLYGVWSLFDCGRLEVVPIWVFAETSTGTLETYTLSSPRLRERSSSAARCETCDPLHPIACPTRSQTPKGRSHSSRSR